MEAPGLADGRQTSESFVQGCKGARKPAHAVQWDTVHAYCRTFSHHCGWFVKICDAELCGLHLTV